MKGHRPNSNTLAIPVPDKEPAGRRSSGLAHLMSALHQNAAAVVNSKTQLNGPDQVKIQILKEKKFLVYFPWALDNFQNCLWPFSDLLEVFSSMAKVEFWIFQLFWRWTDDWECLFWFFELISRVNWIKTNSSVQQTFLICKQICTTKVQLSDLIKLIFQWPKCLFWILICIKNRNNGLTQKTTTTPIKVLKKIYLKRANQTFYSS